MMEGPCSIRRRLAAASSAEKLEPAEGAYYDTYDWGTETPYQREVALDIEALLPPEVNSIADIGCGDGIITNRVAVTRFVIGVDTSVPALASVERPRACGSILHLPFDDAAFDLVMANDVLEHLGPERRQLACGELERIARDYIIVTVPFLENLAAHQILVDGVFRHVNLHFEATDVAKLRGSFRDFSLRACIFSGTTWEDEVDDVERLKVLRAAVESDPALARRRDSLLLLVDAQLVVARQRQAAFLCNHPDEIDGLLRRTEMICFFARNTAEWAPPRSLLDRSIDVTGAQDNMSRIDLTTLDFREPETRRSASIPLYSPLPYWVHAGETRSNADGTTFIAPPSGVLSVKFGFFAPLRDSAKLRLRGCAMGPGSLTVSHYDPSSLYRQIWSATLPPGPFDIEIAGFVPSVSQFGYLFEVAFAGAELTLRDVWIDHNGAAAPTRLTYREPGDYLYRSADGLHLFVSRRIDAPPLLDLVWFQDIEKRRAVQDFRYFFEPKDIYVRLSELELAESTPEGPPPPHKEELDTLTMSLKNLQDALGDGLENRTSAVEQDVQSLRTAQKEGLDALRMDLDDLRHTLGDGLGSRASAVEQDVLLLRAAHKEGLDTLRTDLDGLRHTLRDGLENRASAVEQDILSLRAAIVEGLDSLRVSVEGLQQAVRRDQDENARALKGAIAALESEFDRKLLQRADESVKEVVTLAGRITKIETGLGEVSRVSRLHDDSLTYLSVVTGMVRRAARTTRPVRHAIRQYLGRGTRAGLRGSSLPVIHQPEMLRPDAAAALDVSSGVARLPRTATMLVADDRIDRRVLHQARTLVQQGVKLTVVAAPYPGPRDMDQVEFPELTIVRIDTSRAVAEVPNVASRLRADRDWQEHYFYHYQFLVEALKHPADAYVAHDLPVLPAAIAAADRIGAAVVYDAHELYPEQLVFGEVRQQLYRDVEAEVIGLADAVSTVNLSIAEEMAKRYGIAAPAVILNATDVGDRELPVARANLLRNGLGIGKDKRILLFQGSLSVNRNLENLVTAMVHVTAPDVVLVIMGPGDEKREELRLIAESLGIGPDRLLFHEAVPQRVLLDYTASADAGVIPYPGIDINTIFCTPNKLFEFIAAGLPIVANDLPELRRFVAERSFGIVRPMTTAHEIAMAIDELFQSDLAAFRDRLRAGAHELIWSSQAGVLLGTYRAAMAGRDRRMADING